MKKDHGYIEQIFDIDAMNQSRVLSTCALFE